MQTINSSQHYSIGPDHIEIFDGPELIHISDGRVEGISTHVGRVDDWMQSPNNRRVVVIEYRGDSGTIRIESIELELTAGGHDFLMEYVRRVSEHAAENVMNELLAENRVERKGFTITDEGMLVSANGEILACDLFDITAMEGARDQTVIWTNGPQPIVLTDSDPNSLVVSKVLSKLVRVSEPTNQPQVVGTIQCERVGGLMLQPFNIATVGTMIGSMIVSAIVVRFLIPVPSPIGTLPLFAVLVPLVFTTIIGWNSNAKSDLRLGVLRDGLAIRCGKQLGHVEWADCESLDLIETTIRIGQGKSVASIPARRLLLRTAKNQSFGREISLTWRHSKENAVCSGFIAEKAESLRKRDTEDLQSS